MNFESLALEIHATKAGFEVIKPPRCRGTSGVDHRFSFVASDGKHVYAFDLCQDVGEVEVIRAFLKKIDTGTNVSLVCLRGRPSEEGLNLAKSYDLRILTPADIEPFFDAVRLTVIHDEFEPGFDITAVSQGWPGIVSSLKTLLETGKPMSMTTRRWTGPQR